MAGQLPAQVITERAAILRAIAEQKKRDFLERFIGREVDVLVQGHDSGSGHCRGLSRTYIEVSFQGSAELLNSQQKIRIAGHNGKTASGELVFRGL